MKANEFVRKYGWDRAKREVALIGTIAMMCADNDFNNDLKRLVESHELVESYGGLEELKQAMPQIQYMLFGLTEDRTVVKLKQAIADVESCMEVNQ